MIAALCITFIVLLITFDVVRRACQSGHPGDIPLPPGPKGLPLVGAVFSADPSKPWFSYFQWRKLFGGLIYSRILNMDVLVVNSAKVARDLVELRSNIYSDRPKFVTAEPYGIADGTILMPYGDTWRLHRRIYHQALNAEASLKYRQMQCTKARQLIVNLAEDPQRFPAHLHTYSTSIIMSLIYGYDTKPTNDPFVEYAEKGVKALAKATNSKTAALLGIFPFLLKLPTWVPGSFKAEAAEARYFADGFRHVLFGIALEEMASGKGTPSMISDAIKKNENNGNLPEVALAIRNTSAVAYGGGAETTSSSLGVFVLAMVLHPAIQQRAQKEIDSVVGPDRLPDFSDRPSLPFIEAVVRETLRWHPVLPLGLPHATSAEDVYEGKYVSKGATILVNLWGLAHDEDSYPQPFDFNPERFFNQHGTLGEDNCSFAFGFGRRVCPGRHVASASMWIAIASMLASFDFRRAQDDNGNEIDVSPEFTPGLSSRPKPFPCQIVPRESASAIKELVMQDL